MIEFYNFCHTLFPPCLVFSDFILGTKALWFIQSGGYPGVLDAFCNEHRSSQCQLVVQWVALWD